MLPHYNRPGHSEIVVGPNHLLNTLKVLVNMSKHGCSTVVKIKVERLKAILFYFKYVGVKTNTV